MIRDTDYRDYLHGLTILNFFFLLQIPFTITHNCANSLNHLDIFVLHAKEGNLKILL